MAATAPTLAPLASHLNDARWLIEALTLYMPGAPCSARFEQQAETLDSMLAELVNAATLAREDFRSARGVAQGGAV